MKTETLNRVRDHGQNLLLTFPNATERRPVELCRKLRRLEREGAQLAERQCSDRAMDTDGLDAAADSILTRLDKILGFRAAGVPVFLNGDPRGYAIKIEDVWMRERADVCPRFHRDMGGYGIIAPDLD